MFGANLQPVLGFNAEVELKGLCFWNSSRLRDLGGATKGDLGSGPGFSRRWFSLSCLAEGRVALVVTTCHYHT